MKLPPEEIAARKARRERFQASAALDGAQLDDEQLAMVERWDREGLSDEERLAGLDARYRQDSP